MSASQQHQSDRRVLGARTLERDHRRLAERLRPGMTVLDVGCGTGAITEGIAAVVGDGVVGLDRDAGLLGAGRARYVAGDILTVSFAEQFDVVTAARTLQWVADPQEAVRRMCALTKPGGMVVLLDYTHEENRWVPEPPGSFLHFWVRFLEWRAGNGWDNRMGRNLAGLFPGKVEEFCADEVSGRGNVLWAHVIESIGAQFLTPEELAAAGEFSEWAETVMDQQTLAMTAVVATV